MLYSCYHSGVVLSIKVDNTNPETLRDKTLKEIFSCSKIADNMLKKNHGASLETLAWLVNG